MGGAEDQALDDIPVASGHANAASTTPRLLAVGIQGGALEVTVLGHRHHHALVRYQVLDRDLAHFLTDLGAARAPELLLQIPQLVNDELVEDRFRAKDLFVPGDLLLQFVELVENLLALHARQALELQFDDGLRLARREVEWAKRCRGVFTQESTVVDFDFARQSQLGILGRRRCPDQGDDLVDAQQRLGESEQKVLSLASLAQQEVRAPPDYVLAMGNEGLEVFDQADFLGPAIDDGEHPHARAVLQIGVLVEVVQHNVRVVTALYFKNDAHAGAVALVADIADALDLLLVDQVRSLLDQPGLVDLIRNLADHDCVAVLAQLLNLDLGAHQDVTAPGGVGLPDTRRAAQDAARREVRSLHHRDDALKPRVGVLDQLDRGVHQLAEVVRRDVGRHSHRNAVGAVDQQVRRGSRQVLRLLSRIVVVGPKIDRVHVDVLKQRLGIRRESRLGVAHGRGRVAIDGSKIALPGHQQLAHAERLGHAHQRLVDRRVAMGVVLAHHLADDPGALARRAIRAQPLLAHRVEDAPLNRLEPVSDVRQGPPDDDRHRVVEIRLAHLVLDVDRADVRV